jgi:trk system potassium uptake protein TrkA
MRALVIGCGRVGSTVAKRLASDGWDVAVIDEREEALERLGERWDGRFIVGHGMDTRVLLAAGIEDADAVVVATDGDNTNLVIGQVAQRRFGVDFVVVRVLDPARAELYAELGLNTISPTARAIDELTEWVRTQARPRAAT